MTGRLSGSCSALRPVRYDYGKKKAGNVKRGLAIVLAAAALQAAPGVYLGLGGVSTTEYFTVKNPGTASREDKAMLQAVQVKAGYGDITAYAVELDFGYGYYDKNIFSVDDSYYIYADLSLIKAFDFDIGVYPFFKLGFGTGELEIRRSTADSVSSGNFFGGIGFYWPLAWGFDLEASAVYRAKSWEDLWMVGAVTESSSHTVEPYVGFNYRF